MTTAPAAARRISRLTDQLNQGAIDQPSIAAHHTSFSVGQLLAGKVAIITGSGQGIGLQCATCFAEAGCAVVVNDLDGGIEPALLPSWTHTARFA
jgi:phosphoglycerate dehydrogenase-like enzyme